ncbi:MAG TPA: SRPBCC family protein [Solirubrobacteraceae bacterium]|nr:SRPBCC family protein [Solirubrobacteraceae bacterium]
MPVIEGKSSADIAATVDRCWEVVEDVSSAPGWQGGLMEMVVLERDDQGRAVECQAVSDAKIRKVRTRVRFTYEPPTRLSWTMLDGDLDSMDGYWLLEELSNTRTRATYGVAVDPGPIGLLARGPIERAARAILLNPRPKELAKRVEGS